MVHHWILAPLTLLQGDSPCTPLVLIRLGLKSQTNEPTTKRGFTMEQKKMIEALGINAP